MPKPKFKSANVAVEVMINEVLLMPGMELIEIATGMPFVVHCVAAWAAAPDEACVVLRPRGAFDDNVFLVALHADDLENPEAWLLTGY